MNPPRFDRFSVPAYLQHIGRGRVTQILMPFATELLAHGIALPAVALPDDLFFQVLATLPTRAAELSLKLLEAMIAIEVMEAVYPDETPKVPVVVSELRLRLRASARPILVTPSADQGLLDAGMNGSLAEEAAPYFTVVAEPAGMIRSAPQPSPGPARDGIMGKRPVKPGSRFKFRQKGSVCIVKFNGGPKFHLANTDGAKYLDYLLHRPNEVIRAFDLERAVKPEKAVARDTNSIQQAVDARALREARAELRELENELAEAEAAGSAETAGRIELEMEQIRKMALKKSLLTSDTGERARNNVRKAIGKVIAKLRKGGPDEQAFGIHLADSISLGYDVVYTQPAGKIWDASGIGQ